MVLDVVRHTDVQPVLLQHHLDALLPEGVTQHGDQYIVSNSAAQTVNPNIELLYEYVRRAEFPSAPSRFQSAFAFEALQDAKGFRDAPVWGSPGARIFEVETQTKPVQADMQCLTLEGSILMASHFAHRYWRGDSNDLHAFPGASPLAPVWELLLTPPVRVLQQVA
jgi:hypothetical protein